MHRFLATTLLSATIAISSSTAFADDIATSSNDRDTASSKQSFTEPKLTASQESSRHRSETLAHANRRENKTADQSISSMAENQTAHNDGASETATINANNSSPSDISTIKRSSDSANEGTESDGNGKDKTAARSSDKQHLALKNRFQKTAKARFSKVQLADAKVYPVSDDKDKNGSGNNAGTSKSGSNKSKVNFPERLASTFVGTFVGTPVNMFKKTISETMNATKDLVGDTNKWYLLAPAGVFSIPAGALSGTMQAPVVAGYRAWKHSATDPFSSDSMSLGGDK